MNTIKTAVVAATLLAVVYYANIVMNRPISHQQSMWDAQGQEDSPAIEMPSVFKGASQPNAQPPIDSGMPNKPGPFSPPGGFGRQPLVSPRTEGLETPPTPEPSFQPPPASMAAVIPEYGDSTVVTASHGQRLEPVPPKVTSNFDALWQSSQSQIVNGQLDDALLTLSMLYRDDLTESQRNKLLPLLDQLAGTVIYSRESYLEGPWTGNAPASLQDIAAHAKIPAEFLGRVNGIPVGTVVPTGTSLKIVRGPFRGVLELSRRELTIFLGENYAGRFNVSIGRDLEAVSAPMTFVVRNKAGSRSYLDPRTNQAVAAGDPTNPLGNHWIELANPKSPVIGIHSGRTDASDSRGFISVSEKDADDLQAILSVNYSTISIVP